MSRRRICLTVDLGEGAMVRIQTNGKPPSDADIAALREVRDCLVARLGNPNQWPVDADGREVEA